MVEPQGGVGHHQDIFGSKTKTESIRFKGLNHVLELFLGREFEKMFGCRYTPIILDCICNRPFISVH